MNPWTLIVNQAKRTTKLASKGPIVTSLSHAGITVLGLMPYPFGLLGIIYFIASEHSWAWIAGSGGTLVWYWVREYRQTGLKPTHRIMFVGGDEEHRTLSLLERYDTWLDVLVPTFAYGVQLGVLGWLW